MGPIRKNLFFGVILVVFTAFSITASGQLLCQWGRTASEVSESCPITTDNSGNVYVSGVNTSSSSAVFDSINVPPGGFQSVWVKYDGTGRPLWADGTHYGSTNIYNMTTDPSGNLIIFGNFTTDSMQIGPFSLYSSFPHTGRIQYFLAKVSPSGTVLWAIKDGEPYYDADGFFTGLLKLGDVTTDASGNIYITSSFVGSTIAIGSVTLTNADPSSLTTDIFIAKYTPSGTLVWAKSAGGAANDYAFGITIVPGGNIYIAGAFRSPSVTFGTSVLSNPYPKPAAYIAEFSPAGAPLWAQAAGGSHGAYSVGVKHDDDGNIFMAGTFADTTVSFGTTTLTRVYPIVPAFASFLVKYSAANVVEWGRTISSASASVAGYSLAVTACGAAWVSGTSSHTIVIAPGDSLFMPTTPDDLPTYIVGYDFSGTAIGSAALPVGGDDEVDLACDGDGNVFLGGDFEGTLVAGPDIFIGSPSPSEHFFVAKYTNTPDTTFSHQDAPICSSGSTTIAAPAGYVAYMWDDHETTQVRTISAPGDYIVSAISCSDNILVDTFHVAISPDSVVNRHDTSICIYSDLGLVIPLAASAGTNYLWFNGDTTIADTVTTQGDYWVNYRYGCAYEFDTFHVVFNQPPLPISGSGSLCPADSSVFTDATLGGTWNSSSPAMATIDPVTGIAVGVSAGSLVITYTGATGCYATKSVTVNAPPCTNSVPEVSGAGQVIISPNPATDELTIQMNRGVYTVIRIVNNMGQTLITQLVTGGRSEVNITSLPAGIYYIRFTGEQDTRVVRFIKI